MRREIVALYDAACARLGVELGVRDIFENATVARLAAHLDTIAVGDSVLMLQFSTYSVISPEGCASILWKSAAKAPEAAEALGLTAHRLKALGLIDKIVNEPLGGAHRDPKGMAAMLRRALADSLRQFQGMSINDLRQRRFERLMAYGKFKETTPGA